MKKKKKSNKQKEQKKSNKQKEQKKNKQNVITMGFIISFIY